MFTGLVEATGTVLSVQPTAGGATRLLIGAPAFVGRWRQGDSIAVNGVCLTAIPVSEPDRFAADLAQETIERTSLVGLQPGAILNLELPTPAGAPLGGHVVQGHVDGVGTMTSLQAIGPDLDTTDWRMSIELPNQLATYVVQQGSITVDGISLTVAKLYPPQPHATRLEIAIIPHTYRSTNLHSLLPGSPVNIETDVLARYAERRVSAAAVAPVAVPESAPEWLTTAYLLANGY